jgi:hypothetical protein
MLGSPTLGSCTSGPPTHLSEQTKGSNSASIIPTDGTVTTNTQRAAVVRATAATVALQPKNTSQSRTVGQVTGGHHFIHGGRTKKNPCNRRRKGVTGGRTPEKGHD